MNLAQQFNTINFDNNTSTHRPLKIAYHPIVADAQSQYNHLTGYEAEAHQYNIDNAKWEPDYILQRSNFERNMKAYEPKHTYDPLAFKEQVEFIDANFYRKYVNKKGYSYRVGPNLSIDTRTSLIGIIKLLEMTFDKVHPIFYKHQALKPYIPIASDATAQEVTL